MQNLSPLLCLIFLASSPILLHAQSGSLASEYFNQPEQRQYNYDCYLFDLSHSQSLHAIANTNFKDLLPLCTRQDYRRTSMTLHYSESDSGVIEHRQLNYWQSPDNPLREEYLVTEDSVVFLGEYRLPKRTLQHGGNIAAHSTILKIPVPGDTLTWTDHYPDEPRMNIFRAYWGPCVLPDSVIRRSLVVEMTHHIAMIPVTTHLTYYAQGLGEVKAITGYSPDPSRATSGCYMYLSSVASREASRAGRQETLEQFLSAVIPFTTTVSENKARDSVFADRDLTTYFTQPVGKYYYYGAYAVSWPTVDSLHHLSKMERITWPEYTDWRGTYYLRTRTIEKTVLDAVIQEGREHQYYFDDSNRGFTQLFAVYTDSVRYLYAPSQWMGRGAFTTEYVPRTILRKPTSAYSEGWFVYTSEDSSNFSQYFATGGRAETPQGIYPDCIVVQRMRFIQNTWKGTEYSYYAKDTGLVMRIIVERTTSGEPFKGELIVLEKLSR